MRNNNIDSIISSSSNSSRIHFVDVHVAAKVAVLVHNEMQLKINK